MVIMQAPNKKDMLAMLDGFGNECKHVNFGVLAMIREITGRAKGGKARAKKLSPFERSEIAKAGAAARWGLKATHRGSFREDFGIDVECYVLDDATKTAVISQRGMGTVLGLGDGGSRLPTFVKGKNIANYIGHELGEKLENPLVFQAPTMGGNQPPTKTYGYDITILIDLCKAVLKAEQEGTLLKRQSHIAKQAQIIINASAKAGIQGLVYKLAGYDATREDVVSAFKLFIREEAREYEKEFPDQLYRQWYRLYELPQPERNKPWKFRHLTVDQVYKPLAKSNGKILDLARTQKASGKERHKRLHQFLSDIGVKALRQHLGELIGIAKLSKDRLEYERNVSKVFGDQTEFEF